MEDEWRHEEKSARLAFTGDWILFLKSRNFGGGDSSKAMTFGNHSECAIGNWGFVKVDPKGDHFGEEIDGWLNVGDFVFD